ncbi:hypothetical protein RHGRI_009480 [Rhododendron griersonianum]|uniref:Serine-threonine/tyrosine-protein kinase catalytic domain-containing protein n=1 Tax=Rhododendron griersonianum TaxID=479676 RepID=A0AAV6KFG0_9ERIC|nr:hypothetical protein RHGRI_009480 [Rhododendron griersonianum]KAG5551065.1 hypothetical protein RHGRI_009480 [Rhododendron griersonianum]
MISSLSTTMAVATAKLTTAVERTTRLDSGTKILWVFRFRCDSYTEFSFGVILLELIAGPKPVDKFGDGVDIVRWVKNTILELAQWVRTNNHHKPVQDCLHVRRQETHDEGSRAHAHQSSSVRCGIALSRISILGLRWCL